MTPIADTLTVNNFAGAVAGCHGERVIEETIGEVFAAGGCWGSLSALEIDGPGRLSVAGGELAVAASTFKITIGLEFFCQAAEGEVDPTERVVVSPAKGSRENYFPRLGRVASVRGAVRTV